MSHRAIQSSQRRDDRRQSQNANLPPSLAGRLQPHATNTETVQRERLLFGVAAVLAGIATLEFVLGFVYTPVLFAVAIPFAAAAYMLWYHASGRLRDRVESGRAGSYRRAGADRRAGPNSRADSETGGFGAGPRESYSGRRGGFDPRDARGARGTGGRGRTSAGRARGVRENAGPTPVEAYRILGLDADADPEDVRRAYRERVKAVHPDREGGDEAEFKRVTEAYEVLQERT